ncbi:MAG: maleylpyruvate isomerase N-terminal domain-containing protein [Pseudonocardiaceae bacterium]
MEGDSIDRPRPRPAAEAAAGYRLVRQRIDTLLRGRAEIAELVVPACPNWTVRQIVSHLCGVAQDLVSGNIQGAGTEPWTQAQVLRLAERGLDDLLDLWAEKTDEVIALLPQGSDLAANQLVFDALTHEHDLRGALGEPASRTEDPVLPVALGFLLTARDRTIRASALPAVALRTEVGSWQLGEPAAAPAQLALQLSGFEALRALSGRRSVPQILSLPWRGDATALLAMFTGTALRPPELDLVE